MFFVPDVSHRLRPLPRQLQAQVRHQAGARPARPLLRLRRGHQGRSWSEEKL